MDLVRQLGRGFSPIALVVTALAWAAPAAAQQRTAGAPPVQPELAPPAANEPAVLSYEFSLELPASGKRIRGEMLARLAGPPVTDSVTFHLSTEMQATSVTAGCAVERTALTFAQHGDSLRVAVPSGADAARRLTCLRVRYEGEPADGLIIGTDSAKRWMAFGDNFPNRARHWLPTMDHPSRKATVTFEVNAPDNLTVVANGAPAGITKLPNGRQLTRWHEARPIPTYDFVVAAAPLVMTDLGPTACGFAENGGCVPQMVYTAPEQAKFMPGAFARAGEIVEFFARTVGAYPYEKLAHLQSTTRWGGMENASAIFYYDRAFRRPGGVDDGLIAHETAHQWFGNAVTEREWAHMWLSEGFATFFAALWAQHAHGDSAYVSELTRNRESVLRGKAASERAVIDSVETDPNALLNENSYQKGGLVLHMLRQELGDSVFFAALRRYYAAHRHANALTADLQRAFEETSGQSLGWFFDQWLRRPGWAQLRTTFAWNSRTKRVTLTVEQNGPYGAYRLRLPVEVVHADGRRETVVLAVGAARQQRLEIPAFHDAQPPQSVGCDPRHTLLAVCTDK